MKQDKTIEFFKLRDNFRQKPGVVDLSIGIPCHLPPTIVHKALNHTQIVSGYSDPAGLLPLRKILAASFNNEEYDIDHNNIMITVSGASGGLNLILETVFNPGDEILLADPYFPAYLTRIKSIGLIPIPISTYESSFGLNIKKLEEALTSKTKGLIINSPNNPTGKLYSDKEIKDIAMFAKRFKLTLISDEIYSDFVYEGKFLSPYKYYPERTVVIKSFSKNLALLDFRLGYILGSAEIIKNMIDLQFQISVCPSSFLQQIIVSIYGGDIINYLSKMNVDYKTKRDFVVKSLSGRFEFEQPQGAFYLFAKVPKEIGSGHEFAKLLAEKGLLVMPGGLFSRNDSYIRISFSDTEGNLKKGIKILNRYRV
jgi:aspartate/methionine/tyrosine aminotransferase